MGQATINLYQFRFAMKSKQYETQTKMFCITDKKLYISNFILLFRNKNLSCQL